MAVIEKKYKVEVRDVGTSNLLTNKGFLNLLENIACFHSDIAGYGINQMEKTHLSWVLLNWKVKIFKRPTYNSTITIHTWSRNTNRCSTYRDFNIYDEDGNLLCIASSKWTLVETEEGRIVRISPEVIQNYCPEDNKNVFEDPDIPKLQEPECLTNTPDYTFKVLRRDIDMNNHMHNLYYLDYAIEALPQEIYDNLDCNSFEIMYKSGAKLGDTVNCFYIEEPDSYFVIMKNANDSNKLHGIIKLQK